MLTGRGASGLAGRVARLEERFPASGGELSRMSDRELMARLTVLRRELGLPPPEPMPTREEIAALTMPELRARLEALRRRQAVDGRIGPEEEAGAC